MKIAFGTVVYNASYKFHEEFIKSLNTQKFSEFDIFIVNDGLSQEKLNNLVLNLENKVTYVNGTASATIPELRIQLIKEAKKNNYDLLILGDFDDTFSEDRIEKIVSNFDNKYTFFYNELNYLDSKKNFFKELPKSISNIDSILECNFLGLSNNALNLNNINYELLDILKTKQTLAFDWMLFSILVLQGHYGIKVDGARTYYRIYDNNIAGDRQNSLDGLKKEIKIKLDHYSKLIDFDVRYKELLDIYIKLEKVIIDGESNCLFENIDGDNYWWGLVNSDFIKRRLF